MTDLQFPTTTDLVNYTVSQNSSAITIPSSVIKEWFGEMGDGGKLGQTLTVSIIFMSIKFMILTDNVTNITVSVSFILLRNLPIAVNTSTRAITPCTGRNFTTQGASDVIAAQVGARNKNRTLQNSLQGSPINLNFTFESAGSTVLDSFNCVFWNFSVP